MTPDQPLSLHQEPNYDEFYRYLLQVGPYTLTGVEDWMVEWFADEGTCSELLWREGMQETFHDTWEESPRLAIYEAHSEYIEAVQAALLELSISPGCEGWSTCPQTAKPLNWEDSARQVCGSLNEYHMRRLVAAAEVRAATMQREEPVTACGRTHGKRHQADVRLGRWRRPERQLYEVLLT